MVLFILGFMRIEDWMTSSVITIGPEASIRDALETMRQHSIRHLPVLSGDSFVGLVSLGDLKQSILASMIEHLKISDVMVREVHCATRQTSLEQAARIIHTFGVGCLPVLDAGRLIGILTVRDILKAFIEIMGVLQGSCRIDVVLKQVPGSMDEVIGVIKAKGGEVVSVGMTIGATDTLHYFRVMGGDVGAMADELNELGYRGVSVAD
ncbi:MAG: Inosine-5'-monophosphate dehydrogenase [Deltaproteobacteria bacterium ADurb.Bin510]|nr:MAG: Inosine-5'-monophosphate dehydrogenase [Deltaproteobacteria bacterium ADurb.Bin510]